MLIPASRISRIANPRLVSRAPIEISTFTNDQSLRLPGNLEQHIKKLSQYSRYIGNQKGLDDAANYIKEQWEQMELEVEEQTFEGPKDNSQFPDDSTVYKNLIVSFGPKDAERIIVGAHYDVFGKNNPGADDNASGIAGIIEITKKLKELEGKYPGLLQKRIDVVAYTTEELPYFGTDYMGSMVHAKYLREKNVPVEAVIVLEMIGCFSNVPHSQSYPSPLMYLFAPNAGNFISVSGGLGSFNLARKVTSRIRYNSNLESKYTSVPAEWVNDKVLIEAARSHCTYPNGISIRSVLDGIAHPFRSDHLSYYLNGYDAVMVGDTGDFRNKRYHTPYDLPDTLDYERMAEVVRGVLGAVINLAA